MLKECWKCWGCSRQTRICWLNLSHHTPSSRLCNKLCVAVVLGPWFHFGAQQKSLSGWVVGLPRADFINYSRHSPPLKGSQCRWFNSRKHWLALPLLARLAPPIGVLVLVGVNLSMCGLYNELCGSCWWSSFLLPNSWCRVLLTKIGLVYNVLN